MDTIETAIQNALSLYDERKDLLVDILHTMDGKMITLGSLDKGKYTELSKGHLLIDGFYGQVAEYNFNLSIVEHVSVSSTHANIHIQEV